MVPSEAVIQTGKRNVVIVAQGDGRFVPVDVEVGLDSNGQAEIRKGLAAGQNVVVSGQFLVDSEASLRGTTTRMIGGDSAARAGSQVHHGEGKVEAIAKDRITLSHGPIPTLQWGAMTMGFKPAAGTTSNVRVGDAVSFDIRQTSDGDYEIVSIVSRGARP